MTVCKTLTPVVLLPGQPGPELRGPWPSEPASTPALPEEGAAPRRRTEAKETRRRTGGTQLGGGRAGVEIGSFRFPSRQSPGTSQKSSLGPAVNLGTDPDDLATAELLWGNKHLLFVRAAKLTEVAKLGTAGGHPVLYLRIKLTRKKELEKASIFCPDIS